MSLSIVARGAWCHRLRMPVSPTVVRYASSTNNARSQPTRRRISILSGGLLLTLGVGLSPFYPSSLLADSSTTHQQRQLVSYTMDDTTKSSLAALVRSYFVYTMCSVPMLVDNSPKILKVLTSIPGVRQITEAFVRITFFEQVSVIPFLCEVSPLPEYFFRPARSTVVAGSSSLLRITVKTGIRSP